MTDETLARMFWDRVERFGDRPAQRAKVGGAWVDISWRQLGQTVRELALGLLALGRRQGEAVALLSQSQAEWVQADFAIFSAGCATIPIYPTYPPEQIAYIVNDSEAKTLIVEDAAQLAKALEARAEMKGLEQIILISGQADGQDPAILDWAGLRALGRERAAALEPLLRERLAAVRPGDVASIVYTSGTTGPPKGVVQTHANHLAMLSSCREANPTSQGEVHLLFLPLAHSFARLEAFQGIYNGLTTAFAENLDKVAENLREVSPHFICSVPRVFERVYARILAQVEGGPPLKKKIFYWALGVGRAVNQLRQAGRPIPAGLRIKHAIAHRLVFQKLHQALGGRLRFCVSGGAPLSREIAEFFHAVGILILEGYGLTETCPALTFNRLERFKFGTVGQALPGVTLRIAEDGEILAKGPNIAAGYYKKPEATGEIFDRDGWFHTGDIGVLDAEGFLTITDRKKDLIVTAGGINIAPQNVENLLKGDPFISQAVVYGDRRPYPVALLTLNPEELAKFAASLGLQGLPPAELVRHPMIVERVRQIVEAKNAQLASYAKIKRFAILPEDFTQATGELTPTLKIKRKAIAEKCRDILESLYT